MSDDNAGFLRELTGLTTDWVTATRRRLQHRGTPSTQVDNYYAGGGISERGFDSQPDDWSELRDVKEIRESGGVIAQLVHAKALMQFGTGVEFQADRDEVSEYLNDELNDIDNLVIDLGEDAIWYPSSLAELVETNGGSFSHVEPIEPWTMTPRTNEFGDVIAWEQETKADYGTNTEVFEPDEIAHFVLNKSSGRDKTGISEVLRAEQEIERYRENNEAIGKAVELAGFRRHLWRVGREGGMVIDDNELRRVRNLVDDMKSDTQFVMGMDVDHEIMEAQDVSQFKTIAEIDLRNLLIALGLPIEFASVISEGLGSGEQSGVRWQAFMLDTRASQRALADQFIQEVVRPLLRDYSPFPDDVNVELVFGDPVQDREDKRAEIDAIGSDMTVNERRALFDREPLDDEEAGEGFESPGEGEDGGEADPFAGFGNFSDGRELQGVPDNAVAIDNPGEAPEGAQVIQGPRGGTYYVPGGEGDGDGEGDAGSSIESAPEFSDTPPPEVDVSDAVESTNLTDAGLPDGNTKNDINIVETADGNEVFVKDFSGIAEVVEEGGWSGTTEDDMLNTEMGSAVTRQLGGHTTTNWYDEENEAMLSEGVEDIAGGLEDADFDDDALVDTTAAGILTGNSDLHYRQFVVNGDGEPVLTDHDHAGKDLETGKTLRKAFSLKGPMFWSDERDNEDVWNRMQEMVEEQDIDEIASGLEENGMEPHAEALRDNAEFVRQTDFEELDV